MFRSLLILAVLFLSAIPVLGHGYGQQVVLPQVNCGYGVQQFIQPQVSYGYVQQQQFVHQPQVILRQQVYGQQFIQRQRFRSQAVIVAPQRRALFQLNIR